MMAFGKNDFSQARDQSGQRRAYFRLCGADGRGRWGRAHWYGSRQGERSPIGCSESDGASAPEYVQSVVKECTITAGTPRKKWGDDSVNGACQRRLRNQKRRADARCVPRDGIAECHGQDSWLNERI